MKNLEQGTLTEIKVTKTLNVQTPPLPNFIKAIEFLGNSSLREEMINVEDFTVEQLQELGKAWAAALIDHAEKRRKAKAQKHLAGNLLPDAD